MRMRAVGVFLLFLLGSFFVWAQEGPKPDDVVAEVNGEKITVADVISALGRLSPDAQKQVMQSPSGKMDLLNSIIKKKLLVAEAKKLGIDTLDFVKAAVERAAEDIYAQVLLNTIQNQNSAVTDAEIQNYYQQNDSLFDLPRRYHIAQLVLPDKETAEKLYKDLSKGKISWDDAVTKYPGVGNNRSGDGGWFFETQIVPQAREVIRKLETNQISEPIEVGSTYYIVKVIESEPPRHLSLDEVRDRIRQILSQQKGQQAVTDYQNRLWMQAKISIDNAVLNSINFGGQ